MYVYFMLYKNIQVFFFFTSFQLNSKDQGTQKTTNSSLEEIIDKAYDKFDVEIKSVQLLFAKAGQPPLSSQGGLINSYVYAFLGLAVCVHGSVCSWASGPATVLYTCPIDHLRKPSRSSAVQNAIVIAEVDTGLLILGYPEPFEPKRVHGLCLQHDCELSEHSRRCSWFKLFCPDALRCFHLPYAAYIRKYLLIQFSLHFCIVITTLQVSEKHIFEEYYI